MNILPVFNNIIGQCEVMQNLFDLISKLAEDDSSTVLIQGESGTGKELVAKAIHRHSPRSKKNFVPVNCAAIPDDLLESELFGYSKGAFTGATTAKTGRIEYANGGSLFLDEIGDMKPALQAKLLRVLQEREFEPVGALKAISVDVRVVAATHRNLETMVEKGEFREDLYYRLSVIPVNIPPLRDRSEDLLILIEHFINVTNGKGKKSITGFDLATIQTLKKYPWKGNVRELENLIQHMSILHGSKEINLSDLPEKYRQSIDIDHSPALYNRTPKSTRGDVSSDEQISLLSTPLQKPSAQGLWNNNGIDFKNLVNEFETQLIVEALKFTGGNKKEAARLLNLKRTTLLEKIKKKEAQLESA
jgi:transcriptional regulator with PAS, ATPase and Fis domain